eukprot:scaffold25_cov342-Pavlova_lutheri.AAC.12
MVDNASAVAQPWGFQEWYQGSRKRSPVLQFARKELEDPVDSCFISHHACIPAETHAGNGVEKQDSPCSGQEENPPSCRA